MELQNNVTGAPLHPIVTMPFAPYYDSDGITIYNADCRKVLPWLETVDLLLTDPPYGIGEDGGSNNKRGTKQIPPTQFVSKNWDKSPPPQIYFDELMRVSKRQIIWGGNYFDLPPTRCVIAWDKCQPWENFSQWEMAWTSYSKPAALFKFDNRTGGKIHPTQKPVRLYEWILERFATKGDKILDTHFGSGSNGIACHNMGYELTAYEVDSDYVTRAVNRIQRHQIQLQLPW